MDPGYAMVTGAEPFSIVRMLLVVGLVGCVIGLKVAATSRPADAENFTFIFTVR